MCAVGKDNHAFMLTLILMIDSSKIKYHVTYVGPKINSAQSRYKHTGVLFCITVSTIQEYPGSTSVSVKPNFLCCILKS